MVLLFSQRADNQLVPVAGVPVLGQFVSADHPLHISLPLLLQTQQIGKLLIDLSFHPLVQGSIINASLYCLVASRKLQLYQFGQVIILPEGLLLPLG